MELVLREDGKEQKIHIDPDKAIEQNELIAYKLHNVIQAGYQQLKNKLEQSEPEKTQAEKGMENEKRRVDRERCQPNELWREDPGIDSPEDYV